MNMRKVFKERFINAQKRNLRYLRLLFNDHFVLFLLIAFGGLVLGYREIFKQAEFNWVWHSPVTPFLIAFFLTLVFQIGKLVTYFEPADRLFFLGTDYFIATDYLCYALWSSFCFSMLWQYLAIVSILPIIIKLGELSIIKLITLIAFYLIYKLVILLLEKEQLFQSSRLKMNHMYYLIVYYLIPFLLLGFILSLSSSFFLVLINFFTVVFLLIILMNFRNNHKVSINWKMAIEQAVKHKQLVYQFYAIFAEIPQQVKTIKRRRYLDLFLKLITRNQKALYRLYVVRLARDRDILPLLVNILLVGAILILLIPRTTIFLTMGIGLIILYLVTFQLIPLFKDTENTLWTRIIPIDISQRERIFMSLVYRMNLLVSAILVSCNFKNGLHQSITFVIILIAGNLLLSKIYVPHQLQKIKKGYL